MKRTNMSVARVEKLSTNKIGKVERHNERKNQTYENINVVPERISMNVSFKSPGELTYNEYFDKLISEGKISTRGLREDATLFNEVVIDVNTEYFEEMGGYEYAKDFYGEAYRFCCGLYGEDNIISAVMHADEINKEVSERLGKDVYHYHLHVVAIPTVKKEIKWSARCKDTNLRGTVKEVVHQVSHSKKWKNDVPLCDEDGNPIYSKSGKPLFQKSYSVLQDALFYHMEEAGYYGFSRGQRGSTAEHLTSLEYQIAKDKERLGVISASVEDKQKTLDGTEKELSDTRQRLADEKVRYEQNKEVVKTYVEIEQTGKRSFGRHSLSDKEFDDLTKLAKEGITSRGKIGDMEKQLQSEQNTSRRLRNSLYDLEADYRELRGKYDKLTDMYNRLVEYCRPFIEAMKLFPTKVKEFLSVLLPKKESEDRHDEPSKNKPKKRDWER